jgi:hypothetical protein
MFRLIRIEPIPLDITNWYSDMSDIKLNDLHIYFITFNFILFNSIIILYFCGSIFLYLYFSCRRIPLFLIKEKSFKYRNNPQIQVVIRIYFSKYI